MYERSQSWSHYNFKDGLCGTWPFMWLKLQDRGDKWCKMKMTIYLGYRVVPLKVICHSIGAVFILENKSGEICEAVESICCTCNCRLLLCNCYLLLVALTL